MLTVNKGLTLKESELAAALKRIRKRLGISQQAFADAAGVTKQAISLIERGERPLTIARAAALAAILEHKLVVQIVPNATALDVELLLHMASMDVETKAFVDEFAALAPRLEPHQQAALLELAAAFLD